MMTEQDDIITYRELQYLKQCVNEYEHDDRSFNDIIVQIDGVNQHLKNVRDNQKSIKANVKRPYNAPVGFEEAMRELNTSMLGLKLSNETVVNDAGGKQSRVNYRFDLIDQYSLFEEARVYDEGAKKYGEDNWKLIPIQEHINHALIHIFAFLTGDISEDHMTHAICRMRFAHSLDLEDKRNGMEQTS